MQGVVELTASLEPVRGRGHAWWQSAATVEAPQSGRHRIGIGSAATVEEPQSSRHRMPGGDRRRLSRPRNLAGIGWCWHHTTPTCALLVVAPGPSTHVLCCTLALLYPAAFATSCPATREHQLHHSPVWLGLPSSIVVESPLPVSVGHAAEPGDGVASMAQGTERATAPMPGFITFGRSDPRPCLSPLVGPIHAPVYHLWLIPVFRSGLDHKTHIALCS